MIDNIFEHWQNNRFIIANDILEEDYDHIVVLTDVQYWVDNYEELTDWCSKNGGEVSGMVIEFPNELTMLLFCLRWS